jgi:aryl-alcohol dehydrogenase-like predicted oxidoreductase
MKYRTLGRTGLYVSEMCLGAMTFGGDGFWKAIGELDQAAATKLVETALSYGVNFIDTADVYSNGVSEKMVGQALKDLGVKRSDVVVATKVFGDTGPAPNDRGASRGHILDAIQGSLERLGLDHVDLYQIHGHDRITPLEETLRALEELQRQGLVRYAGVSNWAAWRVAKALGVQDRLGFARLATVQAYYTLAGRDLEREMIPMMAEEGVGLMVWSPLAGGFLSGKVTRDTDPAEGTRRAAFDFPPVDKDRAFDVIDAMVPIAQAHGCSPARIALAWLLHQGAVTSVIVGAKTPEQLEDNLQASEIELTPEELESLGRASALPREYPGWMFERQGGARVPKPFRKEG